MATKKNTPTKPAPPKTGAGVKRTGPKLPGKAAMAPYPNGNTPATKRRGK
jgi:hypothetical protein